jgi:hypothetical protein
MTEQPTPILPKPTFDLEDYIETATDASNRSRYLYIILLVSTILISIGLWNSLYNSWMVADLKNAYKPRDNDATKDLLNISDAEELRKYQMGRCIDEQGTVKKVELCFDCCASPAELAWRDLQQSVMKTHTENRIIIRIPILGIPVHINDLGLFGGLTLITLLLLMRTSLSREIKNLGYSFKYALASGHLDEFYNALARRQLFTIPHMKGEKRNRYLSKSPDAVFAITAIVYSAQAIYDLISYLKLTRYRSELSGMRSHPHLPTILVLIIIECILATIIIVLAGRCMERHYYIYRLWDYYWHQLSSEPYICLLEPEVASKYPTDEAVNAALSKINVGSDTGTTATGFLFKYYGRLKRSIRRIYREEIQPIGELHEHRIFEGARLAWLKPEIADKFSDDKEINTYLLKTPSEDSNSH